MRDKLEPILARLDPRDHLRQPRAHNGLRVQRLAERDALTRPLQALLDDPALSRKTRANDHPPLVVEVAEDNLHPVADLAQRIRHRGTRAVEGYVGGASR